MTGRHDIMIPRGATFRRTFRWLNADRTPINLAGAAVTVIVTPLPGEEIVLSAASGHLTVTPAEGKVEVVITDEETSAFAFVLAWWKLKVAHASGEVSFPLGGEFTVK